MSVCGTYWRCPNCGELIISISSYSATNEELTILLHCCSEKCRREYYEKFYKPQRDEVA